MRLMRLWIYLSLLFASLIYEGCSGGGSLKNNAPVITSLDTTKTSVTAGQTITLTCNASDTDGDSLTYTWSATAGTISGTGASVTYAAPTVSGTDKITVKVSDGKGGEVAATKDISVNLPPTSTASADSLSGTAPLGVQFTGRCVDTDGSCVSFLWDFGDGRTSSEQNPAYTYQTSGDFTVTLTVTDDKKATGTSTLLITVR